MKMKLVDSLTVASLLVTIATGIVGFKPAEADEADANLERIVMLEAQMEDLHEELAYRDSVIRQLVYAEDRESAQLLFETLIAEPMGESAMMEEIEVSGSTRAVTAADLTYDDFKRMLSDWELPLIWYYWHYPIMTFTAFLFFLGFGIMSIRAHRRG